jgi:hypothetical protein
VVARVAGFFIQYTNAWMIKLMPTEYRYQIAIK